MSSITSSLIKISLNKYKFNNYLHILTIWNKFITFKFMIFLVFLVIKFSNVANTSFSQMKLTRNKKIVIYKKKYAEMFENWFSATFYAQFVERLNQIHENFTQNFWMK